ncbi:MAG: alpha/beta fold hydrolase [Acidimicrobiia bacterium]
MATPPVHYTRVDGISLAYQVVGDGPIDVILVDEWATPLEGRWDVPAIAGRLDRLASFARVISFDKRSIGLSDHWPAEEMATPELWVRDLVAVADATGAERPVLFGAHEGGPIAMLYAASLPERTRALVLVNTGPRLTTTHDWPHGVDQRRWTPDLDGITELWSGGGGGTPHIPATAHDPWWRDWYARSRRQQASPADGLRLMRMLGELDVRHIATSVQAPTLVVHRRANRWWPLEGARWLAAQLPNASLVELDGTDNYWWSGNADEVIDHIERFLLGAPASVPSQRELMTIVFTDIVGSTTTATALGDRRWRAVLDHHDRVTLEETNRHGGTTIKNLGDGFLLKFDGPATAIRAATALHRAMRHVGVEIRVSIHTGEVERRGDDISGVAVHLASRMLAIAPPSTTIVSSVIKGLVAGSGIAFAPLGAHRLKGIDEPWELHQVIAEPSPHNAPATLT